jgi:hypothetical protein
MKPLRGLSLLCVFSSLLSFATLVWATDLPESCGDDKVKFDVKTESNRPAPAPPTEGMAQIILIQNENEMVAPFSNATVRYGIDGTWVGANNGNSYFAVLVAPGVHHLCANWQSSISLAKNVGLTSLTAEAGQTYFFAAQITVNGRNAPTFYFSKMNEDEGKWQVKTQKLSTSKPK